MRAEKRRGGREHNGLSEDAEKGGRRVGPGGKPKRRLVSRLFGFVGVVVVIVGLVSLMMVMTMSDEVGDRGHGQHRDYVEKQEDVAAVVAAKEAAKEAASREMERRDREAELERRRREEQKVMDQQVLEKQAKKQIGLRQRVWKDMPPLSAPRLDPYLIKSLHLQKAEEKLDASTCEKHRRAVPMHAQSVDLVKVATADASLPRLMCVVYTYHKNHNTGAKASAETWMSRCDGALILSDANETAAGIVGIPHEGPEEYNNIWQKTRANWRYVYEYYREDFDYFIFGGDDMLIIPQNLKSYIGTDPGIVKADSEDKPLFLGRRFAQNGNNERIFNSGGSGYILNRASLELLYDALDKGFCQPHLKGFWEDVMVAQCLKKGPAHLEPYDTRDPQGRERFHPFTPGQHLTYPKPKDYDEKSPDKKKSADWYINYSIDLKFGEDCCSPSSVAYHYIKPELMQRLDSIIQRC